MKIVEFLNRPVFDIGCKETKGKKFAIELELEGRNVGLADVATRGWQRKQEGSLRGEAIEFTSSGPKDLDELKRNVLDLFGKFKEHGVKLNNSVRTSTHVHVNFSDKPFKQVINFFAAFTLLEEVLQYYSGEDRKGNLFCLGSRDAEAIINVLADAVAKCDFSRFAGDRYKYAACNLCTLFKFGTVEIRTMRGANSAEQVNKWLDIINDLYEYSVKMESPADLVTDLSFIGAEALMKKILSPENYREVMREFPAIATLHHSLIEGARLIQVFAYEFDEAFKAKVDPKKIEVKRKGTLKVARPDGGTWAVYKPDGSVWHVVPGGYYNLGPKQVYWNDGDQVVDDRRIVWREVLHRFVMEYPDGKEVALNWAHGPGVGNEGPPIKKRPLPPAILHDDEDDEDFEPEFDENDFDEGDDF